METETRFAEEISSDIENDAYALLSAAAAPDRLREVAHAIAEANVPASAVTDIFVLKVLLNRHLYTGWESLKQLAAGTKRQGLFRREFGKRAAARAENGQRTASMDRRAVEAAASRSGAESTVAFRVAVEAMRPRLRDISLASAAPAIRAGMSEWKRIALDADGAMGRGVDPCDALAAALARMRDAAGGEESRPLAVVPVGMYVAMAAMRRPYETNMRALSVLADGVRLSLKLPASGRLPVADLGGLPVGRQFVERYLEDGGVFGHSREYFDRHRFQVWTDMTACVAFSLAGRDVDAGAAAMEMYDSAAKIVGGETRALLRGAEPGSQLFAMLRDDDRDAYGYRACTFGVYDAERAERMAMAAAPARVSSIEGHGSRRDALRALLTRDFSVHGSSVRSGVPAGEMYRFARPFGKWRLW